MRHRGGSQGSLTMVADSQISETYATRGNGIRTSSNVPEAIEDTVAGFGSLVLADHLKLKIIALYSLPSYTHNIGYNSSMRSDSRQRLS